MNRRLPIVKNEGLKDFKKIKYPSKTIINLIPI